MDIWYPGIAWVIDERVTRAITVKLVTPLADLVELRYFLPDWSLKFLGGARVF